MATSAKEYQLLFKLKAALGSDFTGNFKTATRTTKALQGALKQVNSTSSKIDGYTKLQASLTRNEDRVKQLDRTLEKSKLGLKELEKASVGYRKKQDDLTKSIDVHEKELKTLDKTTSDYKRKKSELKETIIAEKKELKKLNIEQQKNAKEIKTATSNIKKQQRELEKTSSSINEQKRRLGSLSNKLKLAGVNTNNLAKHNKKLQKSYERLKRSQNNIAKITKAQEKTAGAIANTKGQIRGTIGAIAAVGGALAVGPVKGAMDFESQMANVAKVVKGLKDPKTGKTTLEYVKMKHAIADLTTVIPMTKQELTEIAAAAGQAGIAREEIIAFSTDAAKMGVAFGSTAEESGKWLAKWRTSFKMTQGEVVALADKINYLGNNSAASAPEIAKIVTKIGPIGEVAGFASGEIAALGATLVSVGIDEDVAATGIRKLMTTMTAGESATGRQRKTLDKLGISATDLAKRMQKDATGATLDFLKAVNKLPKAEQTAALKDYFGQEAVGSIAPLLTNLDLLEKNLNNVGDASKYAGSMQDEFNTRSATTENKLALARNQLRNLNDTIGEAFLPLAGEMADKLSVVVKQVTEFARENPELVRNIAKGVAALLAFKLATATVKLGFLEVYQGFNFLRKGIEVTKSGFGLLDLKMLNFGTKLGNTGARAKELGEGFIKAFKGLGGLLNKVPIFNGLGGKAKGAGVKIVGGITKGIKGPLGKIGGIISKPFMRFGGLLAKPLGLLTSFGGSLMNVFGMLLGPLAGILGSILPIVLAVGGVIAVFQILGDNVDGIRNIIENVFGDVGVAIFDKVVEVISNIGNAIKNAFSPSTLNSVKALIKNTFGENTALTGFLITCVDVFGTVGNIIGEFITLIDTYLKPIIVDIFNYIVNEVLPMIAIKVTEWAPTIISILQGMWDIISTILRVALQVVSAILPTIKSVFSVAIEGITTIIGGLLKTLSGIIDFITGVFSGDWEKAWNGVKNIFSGIFESLGGLVKMPMNAVIAVINGAIGNINKVSFDIPDWVPKLGGEHFGISIPKIPMLAKGSNNSPETFIAGEKGAELITGAKGRKVFTTLETTNIFTNLEALKVAIGQMLGVRQPAVAGVAPMVNNVSGAEARTYQITIHNAPTIHTSGDPSELEEALEANNRKLKEEIKREIKDDEYDERRRNFD